MFFDTMYYSAEKYLQMELNQTLIHIPNCNGWLCLFSRLHEVPWLIFLTEVEFSNLFLFPSQYNLSFLMVQVCAGILISFLLAFLPGSLGGLSITSEIINMLGAAFPPCQAEWSLRDWNLLFHKWAFVGREKWKERSSATVIFSK